MNSMIQKIMRSGLYLSMGFVTACLPNEIENRTSPPTELPPTIMQGSTMNLVGSQWSPVWAEGVDNPKAYIGFRMNDKGQTIVTGHGGCNQMRGSFLQSGLGLIIGPLATTKMACSQMAGETKFLTLLAQTRSMKADHLHLDLYATNQPNSKPILQLKRDDWD